MVAQAIRQRQALGRWRALGLGLTLAAGSAGAQDTSYLSGAELAERLRQTLVRIHAEEHGYGIVIGADAGSVYVVTARHVLGAGASATVLWCGPSLSGDAPAEVVAGFDGAREDLALLRVPRPAGFELRTRALAPPGRAALQDPTWLLGRDDACVGPPVPGAIGMPADASQRLRVYLPGVLGGSSGAPVATGLGIVGMTTDSDNVNLTALSIECIAQRVREYGAVPWLLVDARNEPPTDPQAAEQDLAETLNQYLFELHDANLALQQPVLARAQFTQTVKEYSDTIDRYRGARNKYDGTLRRHWQADVFPAWDALRMQLWGVHENFLFVNEYASTIVKTERVPSAVRDRMKAIVPDIGALDQAIARFLRTLSERRLDHANANQ